MSSTDVVVHNTFHCLQYIKAIQEAYSMFHISDTLYLARSLQRLYPAYSVGQEIRGPCIRRNAILFTPTTSPPYGGETALECFSVENRRSRDPDVYQPPQLIYTLATAPDRVQ